MITTVLLALALLPPITQDEAVRFHTDGLCQMKEVGKGITRKDGRGWITSSIPGPHFFKGGVTPPMVDITPGIPISIIINPSRKEPIEWCPKFKPAQREVCGPVPEAFLYDAILLND